MTATVWLISQKETSGELWPRNLLVIDQYLF